MNRTVENLSVFRSHGLADRANRSAEKVETDRFKASLEESAKKKDTEGLKKATQEFESYFIHKLLSTMRKSIHPINRSHVLAQYEDMLDQEYAEKISQSGGIGLSKYLLEQLKRTYE